MANVKLLLSDFPGFVGSEARELMEKINGQYLMWLSKKAKMRERHERRAGNNAIDALAREVAKEVMLDERRERWLRQRQMLEL